MPHVKNTQRVRGDVLKDAGRKFGASLRSTPILGSLLVSMVREQSRVGLRRVRADWRSLCILESSPSQGTGGSLPCSDSWTAIASKRLGPRPSFSNAPEHAVSDAEQRVRTLAKIDSPSSCARSSRRRE